MGSKAVILFGEVYEITIQVTASDEVNNRNTRGVLDAFTKFAVREFGTWNINIKTEFIDSELGENNDKRV